MRVGGTWRGALWEGERAAVGSSSPVKVAVTAAGESSSDLQPRNRDCEAMAESRRKKLGEARPEFLRTPRAKAGEPEPEPEKQPRVLEVPGNLERLAGLLACVLAWVLAWLCEKARTLQLLRTRQDTTLGLAPRLLLLEGWGLPHVLLHSAAVALGLQGALGVSSRAGMGLYYSYFKTLIEAPSFLEGLWMIMNDRLTEYPLVINTVKRFHLYPEVVLAFWYRTFTGIMNLFEVETKTCWNVTRVGFPSEVESCEGGAGVRVLAEHMGWLQDAGTDCDCSRGSASCSGNSDSRGQRERSGLSVYTLCFRVVFGIELVKVSVVLCCILMFGNPVYLSSYYSSSLLMTWLIQGCAWWLGTINLKLLTSKILGVSDHICLSDIIAARILRYADFDTLIYTCAPESYFMEQVLVFHALQLLAFAALAILILRLKLFLTPHICVMASLICSRPLFGWLFNRVHFENVIFGIAIMMSIQGCANLQNQWRIRGEFINLPQEELLHWIKYNTRPGIMPTMASIKLSTLHPIVNHPHYEDADLRARTKIVYSVYSRKSAKEVRDKLIELLVNYYVLEEAWCFVRTKPGCSMLEIWDMEDPSNSANPSLCRTLLQDERPYFTTVFQNAVYRVLKVNREADHIRFV
ncbi:dpy-19-like protein 2 [Heterocephalus glaber]|uniref:Dpy-19-like protein 2 n=1 Tax=Heterocephalus glaber TaxID=10181 RepID=G5B671_HETGA|nr:dpy-19-like protein 2 [Heterocephalus glaber]